MKLQGQVMSSQANNTLGFILILSFSKILKKIIRMQKKEIPESTYRVFYPVPSR